MVVEGPSHANNCPPHHDAVRPFFGLRLDHPSLTRVHHALVACSAEGLNAGAPAA